MGPQINRSIPTKIAEALLSTYMYVTRLPESPWFEHSKYENISASTIPLQPNYPAPLLVIETILN